MIVIDGSKGEGGGQILRSSLALSMCTQTPIRIDNIRAGRKKPGLSRQHLICVQASQAVCEATVMGAEIGSQSITFDPGNIRSGEYRFAIGTAGSTSLVFQTILPALLMAKTESTIHLTGGTHNMWAPSYDFVKHSFLTTLRLMNIHAQTDLKKYGFFPIGGGEWSAVIQPLSDAMSINLIERGDVQISAVVTQAQLASSIADRELTQVQKSLGLDDSALHVNEVTAACPGNLLSVRLKHKDDSAEVIDSIGQKGVSAERVAKHAIKETQRYLNSKAVVGEYLCDQLLLPMVLGNGGRFTTLKPSLHTLTNIEVIKQFVDCTITVTELADDYFEICVRG